MVKRSPNVTQVSRIRPAHLSAAVPAPVRSRTGDAPAEAAHSRAYGVIKEAVLAGKYGPGEIVTLRSLARQLAIGEMPVREALRRLTSEGAFEALPNRSARVPDLDRRQVQQLLELRVFLEGKAAADAARNITLVQIERSRSLQSEIKSSIIGGDSRTLGALNMAFYFEIYRIADNPLLASLIQTLWLRMAALIARCMLILTRHPDKFGREARENHKRLLAALQARDPIRAEQAMRRDLFALTKILAGTQR